MAEPRNKKRQAKADVAPAPEKVEKVDKTATKVEQVVDVDPIIEHGIRRAVAELWTGLPMVGDSPLPSPSAQNAAVILETSFLTSQGINAPLVP